MAATYTVKQVAQILGYSTNSIYTFLKENRIKGVRVGRGRFRVPQSELDRLLLTESKTSFTSQLLAPVNPSVAPTGVIEPIHEGIVSQVFSSDFGKPKVDVPSLFDWFTGIGSIVLGLAMFLFSKTHEEYAIDRFLVWMPAIRTTLIAGGFGLLLSDIVGKKFTGWHRMFHWALIISFSAYAYILGQIGNLEGVVVFGTLAAVLLITFFVAFGGIAGFSLYVMLMLLLIPCAALLSPTNSSLFGFLSMIPVPSTIVVILWFAVIVALAGVLLIGYQRNRQLFWFGMAGVSIFLVLLALNYAQNLWWGRSLFILIAGIISLFVPVWQTLEFTHKRDRAFIFTSFGSLLVLYILVVGVLRVMQTNVVEYASRELQNKVSYSKSLLESTILSTKTTLASSATNPLLLTALEKEDTTTLRDLSKALFEGNTSTLRVAVTNPKGDILTFYPHEIADTTSSYATRDYFIQALTGKKPVTSDIYETPDENSSRKVVVIAVPVIDKKGEVVGVIVGSLDLSKIGNKLQQIASGKTNEYVIVVDRSGKRVIAPDSAQVGTQVDELDPVRKALLGARGVEEGYTADGIRTLVAYDTINDATNWAIAVKAPIADILNATNAAGITIVSVIIVSIFLTGMFLLSHRARGVVPEAVETSSQPVIQQTLANLRKHKVRKDTS